MRSETIPEILRDRDCSIGIIGGGITGLSAALQARKCGAKVHLFESSSRPGGWIRALLHLRLTALSWLPNT